MDLNIFNLNGTAGASDVKPLPEEVTSVFSTNEIEDYKEVFSLFDQTQTGFIRLLKVPRILLEIDGDIDKEALGEIMEKYVDKKIKKIDLNNFLIIAAKAHKESIEEDDVLGAFHFLNPIGSTTPVPNFRQMMQKSGDPLDDKEMSTLINKAVQQQYDKYFNYEILVYKLTLQMEEYERILRLRERSRKDSRKSERKQVKFPTKLHNLRKTIRGLPGALKHFGVREETEEDKDYEDIVTEEIHKKTDDEVMKKVTEEKQADDEYGMLDITQPREERTYGTLDIAQPREERTYELEDDYDDDDYEDDDDDGVVIRLQINKTVKQTKEQEEAEELEEEEEEEEPEEVGEELEEESEEDDYEDTAKYETEDYEDDIIEYDIPMSLLQ